MEFLTENTQICRLCLENETDNGGFLVDIFSPFVNEPGKVKFTEKIRALFGLKVFIFFCFESQSLMFANYQIYVDDRLPSLVCHKCLVFTDNCMEFRDKVKQNDEELRLIFKVEEVQEQVTVMVESALEVDHAEEELEEVITLNPNTLYKSSDESGAEISIENVTILHPAQTPLASLAINSTPPVPPQKVGNGKDRKDIFHCRFCDIVFVDASSCNFHELKSHNAENPFECVVCSFKSKEV